MEKIFVYVDESGVLSLNDKNRFVVVGGFLCPEESKFKLIRNFKSLNKHIKSRNMLPLKSELKGRNLGFIDRNSLIQVSTCHKGFTPFVCIVDKKDPGISHYFDENNHQSIIFNNIISKIFSEIIKKQGEGNEYLIYVDNRNVGEKRTKSLVDHLQSNFISSKSKFNLDYKDSRNNFGIQLADIIVNSVYNEYKISSGIPISKFKDAANYNTYGKKIMENLENSKLIKVSLN